MPRSVKSGNWRNTVVSILQKMAMNVMWKILSEKFMGKMLVHGLNLAADKFESPRLKAIADDVKEALDE